MSTHTISAFYDFHEAAETEVRIKFELHPEDGDGWNTPRTDATVEYLGAKVRCGSAPGSLADATWEDAAEVDPLIGAWAEMWFAEHHDEAFEQAACDHEADLAWLEEQHEEERRLGRSP